MATQNDQTETADTRARRKRSSARLISAIAIGVCVVAVLAVVAVVGFRRDDRDPTAEQPTPSTEVSSSKPPPPPPAPQLTSKRMTLIGEEQFDGAAGSAPNSLYFDYDVGGTGWGNDEKQTYTRDPENVRLDGAGHLVIEARRDGDGFTSARLVTRDKLWFEHGLIEARIKMPAGQGIHPAFWMLGTNLGEVGWPAAGEIDIIEIVNTGLEFHNAIHGPTEADPAVEWKQSFDGPAGSDLAADYHVYQMYREPGLIKIAIDGVVRGQYAKASAPPGARWVFDAPMYLVLNLAVGGLWPGPVDPATPFPSTMLVDWIRYWQ